MIIIDPGHGGSDPGGGSNKYWLEKDLNLKISLYQYQRFKELGIKVALTRNIDEDLYSKKRIEKVKSITPTGKNDLLISNHINVDYGNLDGAEVIYSISRSNRLPKIIASNLASVGQNLSSNGIYTKVNSNGDDYYYIIRETSPYEAIIVEYGFADSPNDDVNILLYKWDQLAEAVVKSVCEYYGYSYDRNTSQTYIVQKGDTLYSIARKYNITIDSLINANGLTSSNIYIGQKLNIPFNISVSNTISYIVKNGDSLYKLSKIFGISINKIKSANNLKNDILYINQSLIIPIEKTLKKYIVKNGDTLYKIALNNNISLEFLKAINNKQNNIIYVGEELLV